MNVIFEIVFPIAAIFFFLHLLEFLIYFWSGEGKIGYQSRILLEFTDYWKWSLNTSALTDMNLIIIPSYTIIIMETAGIIDNNFLYYFMTYILNDFTQIILYNINNI